MLYLIQTSEGRKILDSDAVNSDILIKIITDIRKEYIETFIKKEGDRWVIYTEDGKIIETFNAMKPKSEVVEYALDCCSIRINPMELIERFKDKGLYGRFIEINNNEIYV